MPASPSPPSANFACTGCGAMLPLSDAAREIGVQCPGCEAEFWATVFPAHLQPPAPSHTLALAEASDASCFFHPTKQAQAICETCGRFLCGLCEMDFSGHTVCATCLEAGVRTGSIESLRNQVTHYDTLALLLATLPALLIWPSLIASPIAIFLSIRYWKAPLGARPRTRIRFVLAILFALMQLVGWALLFVFFFQLRGRLPK